MTIIRFYKYPALDERKTEEILYKLKAIDGNVESVRIETCYHLETSNPSPPFSVGELGKIKWLLAPTLDRSVLKTGTSFIALDESKCVIECGPRFNFSTADSSNAVQICKNIDLASISRCEVSYRYLISLKEGNFELELMARLSAILYDRMTHCIYDDDNLPKNSFDENLNQDLEPWFSVPVLEKGRKALEYVNTKLGLAFDEWDLEYYTDMFVNKLKRNPTSVECFDLAQSNSEHSRHWFFKGKLIINGKEQVKSLIEMIMETQNTSNNNNVIKFSDNSSAIIGFNHQKLIPGNITGPERFLLGSEKSDIIFTAETHNMPTAVCPFSGAATGTGGRIRDIQAVGRGGHCVAGTAGYCVGNLNVPGFDLPWEDESWSYPYNFATPLDILIEASNGASDYGNKFGEPIITGFVISYGMKNMNVRQEYVKPVMFSGGIGYMPHKMIEKVKPQEGNLIAKLGGPVYRIGVGGGAASSVAVQGDNERSASLDFGAVQRGDAEMGNRLNRVIRSCLEAKTNPILSIHDQGAGGNGNVLKELVDPKGAMIFTKEFKLGDPTITTMELWGAEYQENNAILCSQDAKKLLEDICQRERCPISFVGEVTNDGKVRLIEDSYSNIHAYRGETYDKNYPFDLNLDTVLGKMPRKEFNLTYETKVLKRLSLPPNLTVMEGLTKIFKLASVGSKRYLTNKVDRCVTGLVAQQQCVGPLHTPLADYGMIALSHFDMVGAATSIGTQPIKGLVYPQAGARMAVGEALTNLVFAGITSLSDVKCSGNWMWSGKTGEEGGRLYLACKAMCELMSKLEIAIDGGKDSLSMSAGVLGERIQSPGTLVISAYAPCPNIGVKVQPYFKEIGSTILWIPITPKRYRLGGSALAQCFKQLGDESPDVDKPLNLKNAFEIVQNLLREDRIIAGHDISDGGFITCVLEMAFAGLVGIYIDLNLPGTNAIETLFNEELGLILEIRPENYEHCVKIFSEKNMKIYNIGYTVGRGMKAPIRFSHNGDVVLNSELHVLFRLWEEVSYKLELLQANTVCVEEEWKYFDQRSGPKYAINFDPEQIIKRCTSTIRVAVIREEGTNGDREMSAALFKSRFEVYDITMSDLIAKKVTLDRFKGVVFPGGFSYGDTLGSAKGWAANIIYNKYLFQQFDHFAHKRDDTFSLGVCNGCQLMPLIGWIKPRVYGNTIDDFPLITLERNKSERFECRWSCVLINTGKGTNLWFEDMEFSKLGVWIAHGEGRFAFKTNEVLENLIDNGQICMQYVDDSGSFTETYPMNPNGSPLGVASICSTDGRHLAMMPHPERCILNWQCPVEMIPNKRRSSSPWQKMFNNAYVWASKHYK